MIALILAAALVADEPPCPLERVSISQYGLEARITGANRADYAVDHITVYLTYNDALGTQHTQRFAVSGIAQPHQTVNVTSPMLEAYPVWSTVDASFTCRQLTD